jgi:hypothetical protein
MSKNNTRNGSVSDGIHEEFVLMSAFSRMCDLRDECAAVRNEMERINADFSPARFALYRLP